MITELEALKAIAAPEERMRALNQFYADLDTELAMFATARLHVVTELRKAGWSYERIAAATNLSKPRVAQLARAANLGGRLAGRRPE